MSVQNFKPTLWEGALLHNFHSVSTADAVCVKPSEINGNKVIFNRVGAGTIKDYEGTIEWDDINTTPIEMTFDKKKYFAFSSHKIGSASSKKKVTQVSIYDYIVDLGTILSKAKVPKTERYVTVDAEILGLLSKDKRFTDNPQVLVNGVVNGQVINGMQVVCTEEKPAGIVIAHHKSAIGAAKQLDKMEAMRLQSAFADGVRGLCMYGSKILRDDGIAVLYYEIGTAADIDPINVKVANTESDPVHTKTVTG